MKFNIGVKLSRTKGSPGAPGPVNLWRFPNDFYNTWNTQNVITADGAADHLGGTTGTSVHANTENTYHDISRSTFYGSMEAATDTPFAAGTYRVEIYVKPDGNNRFELQFYDGLSYGSWSSVVLDLGTKTIIDADCNENKLTTISTTIEDSTNGFLLVKHTLSSTGFNEPFQPYFLIGKDFCYDEFIGDGLTGFIVSRTNLYKIA